MDSLLNKRNYLKKIYKIYIIALSAERPVYPDINHFIVTTT